ncbi:MAG TPA: putative lipid II flippase FtsW [Candidatus Limnocylindria bacterium]|nr:putative lipid II flippase FtsW [Candidatus Limnocylindria bacterium]
MNIGKRHENLILTLCTLILVGLGAVMVYSASSVTAEASERLGHDAAYYFKRQVLFLVLGASLALFVSRVDYDVFRRRIGVLMGGTLLLLVLVYVPGIRHTANGASRWIDLRFFTFQPSELAKFSLIAYGAYAIDRKGENFREGVRGFLPLLAVLTGYVALILKEPDFGMSVVITASFMALLVIAGFPWKYLAGCSVAGIVGVVLAIAARPYRMARLSAFLDPFSQAQSAGYQVVQSLIAFSNGGLLGTGIGAGKQKLFYLPAMHTDYIFSVIGEELGFAGVVAVGACFMTLVWVGFRIGRRARDPFGKYFAMGVSIVIGVQALANMMVGLKMLPPKGMVLPFLSYGGSSLVLHLAAIGVLTNISMKGAEVFVAEPVDRRRGNRRARVPGDSAC